MIDAHDGHDSFGGDDADGDMVIDDAGDAAAAAFAADE